MKTSDLIGPALDWAVAKCWYGDEYDMSIPLFDDGLLFAPSTNWFHGGPIIEREGIDLLHFRQDDLSLAWEATDGETFACGPTPLVAAMRCYVASKLGDDVNIPSELEAA